MASKICQKFLKSFANTPPPDIIGWIQRFLSVDKDEDRTFPRNLQGIGTVSFHYLVANQYPHYKHFKTDLKSVNLC